MQALTGNHATLMDDVYRGQRHIYDLTRKYYLLGRDRLIEEMDVPDGGTVLEIGCGTGRNLARIAKRYPGSRLYGLDISEEMLKSAASNLSAARCGHRTDLAYGDAASFESLQLFGRARFDRIMFSYTLSMIPDWQGALRQAASLLSTQGRIHIVDFGMQERLPGWSKQVLLAWLARFHVAPRTRMQQFTKELGNDINRPVQIHAPYRGYAQMIIIG